MGRCRARCVNVFGSDRPSRGNLPASTAWEGPMTSFRAILVLAAVTVATPAFAAAPVVGKAKRLAPEDPKPVSVAVPQEPKVEIAGSCKLGDGACADYQGAFAGVDLQA